jgi:predicted NBD/HSP70 family sugar kinase
MREMSRPPPRSLKVTDTANSLLQNRINISIIFNYLRDQGVAYRARLARELGISAPAVSRAIEKLLKDGYVKESEKVRVENGKKAAQVSVNIERGFVVGIDLMADPIKIAISDFGGTVRDSRHARPYSPELDFSAYLIEEVESSLASFERRNNRRRAKILAMGIGVPAVVDPQTGAILSASLYEGIAKSNFADALGERFKIPVFIENTANLSAIGEWKRGIGKSVRNLVFIEVGNGIGAGIILDGDLYRGARGAAGEIGYFITELGGLAHDSSKAGYLESKAALGALQPLGGAGLAAGGGSYPGAAALFDEALAGEGGALAVIEAATKHLAVTIINLMLLLNPELVVVGGALCELPGAYDLMLKPLIEEIVRHCPLAPSTVRLASLGAEASLSGALQFALDSLIVHAYPYRI